MSVRLLAGVATGIAPTFDHHLALYGPLGAHTHDDLITAVEQAGLRGRGGAAFPTAAKLRAVAGAGGRPVVVVNAVEGEPASGKDRALLRFAPHLVLDGAVAACRALGARDAVVAMSDRTGRERAIVEAAIAQRKRGDGRVELRTAAVADRFIAGEETALMSALGGREAKPSLKPPYPSERGLAGAPTLVANAETIAHVGLIARFGAGWFRGVGAPDSPGTALITLGGAVARPGVHEIELGTPLDRALDEAGGASGPVQAILVGGYFGRWVKPSKAPALRLTPDVLGAGAIVVLPAGVCAVSECARVLTYLAGESAGQCGPCVHGLRAIADTISVRERSDRRARLEQLAVQVSARGACRHPDGTVGFLRSALDVFAGEFALHAKRGRCAGRNVNVLPIPAQPRR